MGDIIEMIESVRVLLSSEQQLEDDEIDSIRGDCTKMIISFTESIKFHAEVLGTV